MRFRVYTSKYVPVYKIRKRTILERIRKDFFRKWENTKYLESYYCGDILYCNPKNLRFFRNISKYKGIDK